MLLLLFVLFACENDFKTENIVFGPSKTLHVKAREACHKNKLALDFCCYLDLVANILPYQIVKYRQNICNILFLTYFLKTPLVKLLVFFVVTRNSRNIPTKTTTLKKHKNAQ